MSQDKTHQDKTRHDGDDQATSTPPSKAPGESGDREARREADEAVISGDEDGEAGDALTPNTDAQRRTAGH